MRGYKIISLIVVGLYFVGLGIFNFVNLKKMDLLNDGFLKQQIKQVISSEPIKIVIYGSSGVLAGLSAKKVSEDLKYSSKNLSTSGLGGQFDRFLDAFHEHDLKDRVVIFADRSYRSDNDFIQNENMKNFYKIIKTIEIVPNFKSFLQPKASRDEYGDTSSYIGEEDFSIDLNKPEIYLDDRIALMKRQIEKISSLGGCPILAFVPLLVPIEYQIGFENQSNYLLQRIQTAGIGQNVVNLLMVETDKSLFVDAAHMSEKGRKLWTQKLTSEIKNRDLCGLN